MRGIEHDGERDEARFWHARNAHRRDHAHDCDHELRADREVHAVRLRDEQRGHALIEHDAVVVEVGADACPDRGRRA
jgi:hypothetical protein